MNNRKLYFLKGLLIGFVLSSFSLEIGIFFMFRQVPYGTSKIVRISASHFLRRIYTHFDDKILSEIRKEIPREIREKKGDFEKAIALRQWIRTQASNLGIGITAGTPLKVLESMRKGEPVSCGAFGYVYAAVCQSIGIPSRIVQLMRTPCSKEDTHITVEIWAERFNKWVVMDPLFNSYFVIDGIPASVQDLHLYLKSKKGRFSVKRNSSNTLPDFDSYYIDPILLYKYCLYLSRLKQPFIYKLPILRLFREADAYYFSKNWGALSIHYWRYLYLNIINPSFLFVCLILWYLISLKLKKVDNDVWTYRNL